VRRVPSRKRTTTLLRLRTQQPFVEQSGNPEFPSHPLWQITKHLGVQMLKCLEMRLVLIACFSRVDGDIATIGWRPGNVYDPA